VPEYHGEAKSARRETDIAFVVIDHSAGTRLENRRTVGGTESTLPVTAGHEPVRHHLASAFRFELASVRLAHEAEIGDMA